MSRIKDNFVTDRENEVFNDLFCQEPDLEPEVDRLMWEQREMEADPEYMKNLMDSEWWRDQDEHI